MNYTEFISKYNGKAIDYDGVAGVQCVDLVKCYLDEVFGVKPGAWGDAHCYFDNFNSHPELIANFDRIANTPEFVPQKGDICVWKSSLNSGGWGHIAIATGEGDTTYFWSHDQNWTGKHDPCTKVKHNYSSFAGVLRPKDQSKVTGGSATTSEFKVGAVYTLAVNVKVRDGAGTSCRQKLRSELTPDGQAHAVKQSAAVLITGTKVTVQELKAVSGDIWARIPSGWIALRYQGQRFVK